MNTNEDLDINFENENKYIDILKQQQLKSLKLQLQDDSMINAKVDGKLAQEGKVLAIWQERQLKWEKIRMNIHKKVHGTKYSSKTLLMEAVDDYRPKMEEYDVLQAARPEEERFSSDLWASTLNKGGHRIVMVGNSFSGLECIVDKPAPIPSMVRKPKILRDGTVPSASKSFINPNKSFRARTAHISKHIATVRPHIASYEDCDALVVQSSDLFSWAIDSTQEYFNIQHEKLYVLQQQEKEAIELQRQALEDINVKEPSLEDSIATLTNSNEEIALHQPYLEYLSSTELLFKTLRGVSSRQGLSQSISTKSVSFRNNSNISIEYEWVKLNEDPFHLKQDTKYKLNSQSILKPRESVVFEKRNKFQCVNAKGKIFPGQVVSTDFNFLVFDLPGKFHEAWQLMTTPVALFNFLSDEDLLGPLSTAKNHDIVSKTYFNDVKNENSSSTQNSLKVELIIHLNGHNVDIDEVAYSRRELTLSIEKGTIINMVHEIIEACIDRTRLPVRQEDILSRERDCFSAVNSCYIHDISTGKWISTVDATLKKNWNIISSALRANLLNLPIYLTNRKIAEFYSLYQKIFKFANFVIKKLVYMKSKCSQDKSLIGNINEVVCTSFSEGYLDDDVDVNDENNDNNELKQEMLVIKSRHEDPESLCIISNHNLFPERKIDIFDEVTSEDIYPRWDYSLKHVFETIDDINRYILQVIELENILKQVTSIIAVTSITSS